MTSEDPMDRMLRGIAPHIEGMPDRIPGDGENGSGVVALLDEEPRTAVHEARPRLRRWAVGVPIAAAAATAAVVGGALLAPSSVFGPDPAQALEISEEDGYIVGEVVDPLADPDDYAAEFAEHGLDVRLVLQPEPEEYVGTLISVNSSIAEGDQESGVQVVDNPGNCRPAVRGCPVSVKVPKGHDTPVEIVVGRGATEAETWDGTSVPEDPMKLAVLKEGALRGLTVGELRERLKDAGLFIETYWKGTSFDDSPKFIEVQPETGGAAESPREPAATEGEELASAEETEILPLQTSDPEKDQGLEEVPDDWYVTDVSPSISHGELSIVVSEHRPE